MEVVRNMKHTLFLTVLLSLAVSAPLSAKGEMVLIEVTGANLPTPIRITDPKIEAFSLWAGPGVNGARVPNAEGFIVDWRAGVLSPRAAQLTRGVQHYEISFYEGCRTSNDWCTQKQPRMVYVVSYDYDPASPRGFVYLPGKGDASYQLNIGTIWRRVEGNWFFATASWEEFIRPVIDKAITRSH
jgi:hypothetical protein